MNIAIIGCGLIGRKRAKSFLNSNHKIAWLIDTNLTTAEGLAKECGSGARASTDWQQVAQDPEVHIVVVATSHRDLAPLTQAFVEAAKHVLVEKPAGVSADELAPIVRLCEQKKRFVKVGFNHRYHPSFLKMRELVDTGEYGRPMFVRGRYGHGGRVGYEKEWRAQKALSGGGEMIDQGMHLIDLSRWFLGDFTSVHGELPTLFWKMDVEDNCFMSLKTQAGQVAWLHAGWTEWKNLFSFELMCERGKFQVDGLGGSYGLESLTVYKMLPQMGPPETVRWEYPFPDQSWDLEAKDFVAAIEKAQWPMANVKDAHAALQIVDKLYQEAGR